MLLTLLTNVSIKANILDHDQTASEQSDLVLYCLSKRLLKHFSRRNPL